MKKLGIVLLVLVMVLALAAGCKVKYTPSAKSDSPSANREVAKGSVSVDPGFDVDESLPIKEYFKILDAESGGGSYKASLDKISKDGAVLQTQD